jgi:hypothetical protein
MVRRMRTGCLLLMILALVAGCGSSYTPPPMFNWAGEWQGSGSLSTTCTGSAPSSSWASLTLDVSVFDTLTLFQGAAPEICDVMANIVGDGGAQELVLEQFDCPDGYPVQPENVSGKLDEQGFFTESFTDSVNNIVCDWMILATFTPPPQPPPQS